MWQKTTGSKVLCVYIVREKFKITFNINFAWYSMYLVIRHEIPFVLSLLCTTMHYIELEVRTSTRKLKTLQILYLCSSICFPDTLSVVFILV